MSSRRYHIEVEVDNIDPEREEAVTEAMRIAGRQVITSLMFICGENPRPTIVLWAESLDTGRTDVALKQEDE